jgi:hypothetical protein
VQVLEFEIVHAMGTSACSAQLERDALEYICRVGKGALLQIFRRRRISRAVPTRSAFRVGKIAIDAAYACSCVQAILPTLQRDLDVKLQPRRERIQQSL